MIDKLVIGFRNGQRITLKVNPPDGAERIVRELGEVVDDEPSRVRVPHTDAPIPDATITDDERRPS